jgi:hypothetical protein
VRLMRNIYVYIFFFVYLFRDFLLCPTGDNLGFSGTWRHTHQTIMRLQRKHCIPRLSPLRYDQLFALYSFYQPAKANLCNRSCSESKLLYKIYFFMLYSYESVAF